MYNGWRRFYERFKFFTAEFRGRVLYSTVAWYNRPHFNGLFVNFRYPVEYRRLVLNVESDFSAFDPMWSYLRSQKFRYLLAVY